MKINVTLLLNPTVTDLRAALARMSFAVSEFEREATERLNKIEVELKRRGTKVEN